MKKTYEKPWMKTYAVSPANVIAASTDKFSIDDTTGYTEAVW